jgi:phage tail sheath protein FI
MPDYLSPGVYVEELPPALRAIEGVSTSTAGFVGKTERGPVAGFPPPLQLPTTVQAPPPSLVTSFSDFTRQFGKPLALPDPNNNNYLAYAVKGFFDNGGSRCYISRVVASGAVQGGTVATYSSIKLNNGTVLRLTRSANPTDTILYLNSLRRISVAAAGGPANLTIFARSDGSATQVTVRGYDSRAKTVTLSAAIGKKLLATDVYLVSTAATIGSNGPTFLARNPGSWGDAISVVITPSDRPSVAVSGPGTDASQQIGVQNTSSFYVGAIIEIDRVDRSGKSMPGSLRTYSQVTGLLPGGILQLAAPLGDRNSFDANALVRVVEIDITISDPTAIVATSETYPGLSWSSAAGNRYYATNINANSNLAFVRPDPNESADPAFQPTTQDGFEISPKTAVLATNALKNLAASGLTAVTAVVGAITALEAAGGFPLAAGTPVLTNATTADQDATRAAAAIRAATTSVDALTIAAQATTAAAQAQAAVTAAVAGGGGAAAVTAARGLANAALLAATAANTAVGNVLSAGSSGGDGDALTTSDYVGVDNGQDARTGIAALTEVENISIIAAPGQTDVAVQAALIDQCELLRYRFAVLDGNSFPNGLRVNDALTQRDNYDTSYAALYLPWLQITANGQSVFIPPAGHVVGVYAGTDQSRGVWKAPANVVVQNITGLQSYIVTGEQDILNPAGVNCIRRFDTLGTRVWGARTISSDDSLMYVNVRRTLIFLEASIDQGTQWVVFEPNNQYTWERVVDSITAFLTTMWANGALFGAKPSDSFFVRCDLTTMTADDIQNGRLICLIGVAIVRPAEFVIFRIEQITGLPTQ